jgi:hypothetical protein
MDQRAQERGLKMVTRSALIQNAGVVIAEGEYTRTEAGLILRDLTNALLSGAFDFANGPNKPTQPQA